MAEVSAAAALALAIIGETHNYAAKFIRQTDAGSCSAGAAAADTHRCRWSDGAGRRLFDVSFTLDQGDAH